MYIQPNISLPSQTVAEGHLSDGPADPNACAASRRLSIRDIKEPSCNGCDGSSGHADEMPTNEGRSLRCFVDESRSWKRNLLMLATIATVRGYIS